ncbi:MAG TPA: hypothetical protein VMW91_07585, partial [Desulfosporosinus sp.]|nr:hypothetical protein [Desulfosporosinus sp.]
MKYASVATLLHFFPSYALSLSNHTTVFPTTAAGSSASFKTVGDDMVYEVVNIDERKLEEHADGAYYEDIN